MDSLKQYAVSTFLDNPAVNVQWTDEDGNTWEYQRPDNLIGILKVWPVNNRGPRYFQVKVSEMM